MLHSVAIEKHKKLSFTLFGFITLFFHFCRARSRLRRQNETETESCQSSSQSSPSTCISRGSSPYNKLQRTKTEFFLPKSKSNLPKSKSNLEKIQHELSVNQKEELQPATPPAETEIGMSIF